MKNQKGITLIALVITIIVLLILAGVAISMISGDDGVLSKAKSATKLTKIVSAKEEAELVLSDMFVDFYKQTEIERAGDYIAKEMKGKTVDTPSGEFAVSVSSGDTTVTGVIAVKEKKKGTTLVTGGLQKNGTISWDDTVRETFSTQISEDNYGEYVDLGTSLIVNDNIALEDGEIPATDWRIFHKDEDGGVWLILADYLPYSYEATVGSGLLNNGADYPYNWKSNTSRADLLQRLGNSNAWNNLIPSAYVAKGATVTGAVDLETWVESWNASGYTELFTNRYSNVNGSAQGDGLDGYYIGTAENPETTGKNLSSQEGYTDTLYFPHKNNTSRTACGGYWLASPSAYGAGDVMDVHYDGSVDRNHYDYGLGGRPAVYLPSGISAEKNSEGIWEIK